MLKKMYDLQKKKGKKGFSMIELIIVIAIMAILIALIGTQLIPYMEKSRIRKDESTLDACLTNFQSAMSETECAVTNKKATGIADMDTSLAAGMTTEYQTYAGAAYDTDQEILDALKSNLAGSATDIEFGITAEGVIYVFARDNKGKGLVVSAKYSGDASGATAAGLNLVP